MGQAASMTATEVAAMRIELTLTDGTKQEMQVAAVVYVPTCKNVECPTKEFRTVDPRREYCSYECQAHAKYRRWQTR